MSVRVSGLRLFRCQRIWSMREVGHLHVQVRLLLLFLCSLFCSATLCFASDTCPPHVIVSSRERFHCCARYPSGTLAFWQGAIVDCVQGLPASTGHFGSGVGLLSRWGFPAWGRSREMFFSRWARRHEICFVACPCSETYQHYLRIRNEPNPPRNLVMGNGWLCWPSPANWLDPTHQCAPPVRKFAIRLERRALGAWSAIRRYKTIDDVSFEMILKQGSLAEWSKALA